jgi:hypothetical protein
MLALARTEVDAMHAAEPKDRAIESVALAA